MDREMLEREIKETLGTVPAVLDWVPDEILEAEWRLLRRSFVDESLIPPRYRALMGVAVAAALRCPSSIRMHTALARAQGASEAELAEAVHHAAFVAGWSTRVSGFELGAAVLEAEVTQIIDHTTGGRS
jgi:AhpD family alkylhydroperoxidase